MRKLKSLLLLSVVGFVACETEHVNDDSLEVLGTNDVALEVAMENVETVLDDVALYSESAFGVEGTTSKSSTSKEGDDSKKRGRSGFFKECADIIIERNDSIITKTITFSGACEDRNGNIITGTITKVKAISGNDKEKTVTIDSLSINGYVVNGTKTYTYVASNDQGNPEMTGSIDISVETEDGVKTKVGSRTVEISAGGDTDTWEDDEKTITGSFMYTNANQNTFNVEITTPLVKPVGCRYIASGIKEYTRNDQTTILDYGDGTCDKIAIKTSADGTLKEITLGKKRKG